MSVHVPVLVHVYPRMCVNAKKDTWVKIVKFQSVMKLQEILQLYVTELENVLQKTIVSAMLDIMENNVISIDAIEYSPMTCGFVMDVELVGLMDVFAILDLLVDFVNS